MKLVERGGWSRRSPYDATLYPDGRVVWHTTHRQHGKLIDLEEAHRSIDWDRRESAAELNRPSNIFDDIFKSQQKDKNTMNIQLTEKEQDALRAAVAPDRDLEVYTDPSFQFILEKMAAQLPPVVEIFEGLRFKSAFHDGILEVTKVGPEDQVIISRRQGDSWVVTIEDVKSYFTTGEYTLVEAE